MRELTLEVQRETKALTPFVTETIESNLPAVIETTDPILEREAIARRIDQLKSMGFMAAAKKAESAHKMVIAYGEYTFISQETIRKFNDKLRKETLQEDSRARRYKTLVLIHIEDYGQIPPAHVLSAISEAKKKEIFDRFEVAKIDWKQEIKDPIVFGRIDGCDDLFFIAQWDDDVRIEDLLRI